MVVTVEVVGAGVVIVVCSEVVVRLVGVEPQADRTVTPATSVMQVAMRTYVLLLIMIWILESYGAGSRNYRPLVVVSVDFTVVDVAAIGVTVVSVVVSVSLVTGAARWCIAYRTCL